MVTINRLSPVSSIQSGDQVPVFDTSNGDTRKFSISLLLSYIQDNITLPDPGVASFVTQYAAPSSNNFIVNFNDNSSNTHLILTPSTGYAEGTLVLPAVGSLIDKQEMLFNTTQQVDTLTIDKNGAVAVTGAPVVLAAEDFFRLKYDAVTSTWYRVG
jgi:hypothetical protein